MKKILLVLTLFSSLVTDAQLDARLLRFPDVSATQIAFVYGGDIWIVPKVGGTANRVTTSTGEESSHDSPQMARRWPFQQHMMETLMCTLFP
jgi:tricorn protease